MIRAMLIVVFYFAALVFIWAGFNVPGVDINAPGFWPRSDAEIGAAILVCLGMLCKLNGHVLLLLCKE